MTIRKRIFLANTMMVLLSLVVLLALGGGMLMLFEGSFFEWYGNNSQIVDNYADVSEIMQQVEEGSTDWTGIADCLAEEDFRLIVLDDQGKISYSNARHNEMEATEGLFGSEAKALSGHLVAGVTILERSEFTQDGNYTLFAVGSQKEIHILGQDQRIFRTFIIVFLLAGLVAIAIILLISQKLTRHLIGKIMEPVERLDAGALRVANGDLEQAIAYERQDEFTNVCNSFDLMQTNLKDQMEQNAAYEKARIEMVSGISHDLRTPLTSMKGYVKGMLDGVANTEEKRREYLQIAYRKSCDMDRLLEKLFYFSKLETGNMPLYFETMDLGRCMEKYASEKAEELQTKDIRLVYDFGNILGAPCCIDRDQWTRIFDNLVDNAIKYGRSDKPMVLTMGGELSSTGTAVNLYFKDNGPGMPADKIAHVFEQFYRGDEARSAVSDGSGLGLYMCRYLIQKHGGSIVADGEDGFCLRITVPIVIESDEEENDD